jgi:hypothetical protein
MEVLTSALLLQAVVPALLEREPTAGESHGWTHFSPEGKWVVDGEDR